ncbi:MAG TPA: hypothetical protein VMX18_02885 [Candidatus Bipolaricaulota bacterium]|nr:hypothetical protein [Candidatus Bipolaricaulota bacterium]
MVLYKVRLSHIYRKLIFVFLIACAILILFVVLIVFNKAVIKITPEKQTMKVDFPVNIMAGADSQSALSIEGKLNDVIIEKEKEFSPTGKRKVENDIIGSIKLINEYSKDQPLVATTRLKTSDGILLRLKNSVTVPAGGSVNAKVYADDPNSFKEIKPTKFTIPGLWEGLQDQIYGESSTTFLNSAQEVGFVQQKDIDRAKEELLKEIEDQVSADFVDGKDGAILVVDKEILEEEVGAKVDDITDKFTVKTKVKVTVVMFDRQGLYPIAGEQLLGQAAEGFSLSGVDLDNFDYTIESFDLENETVTVMIHAEGRYKLDEKSQILDKETLMGLTEKGAELYLNALPEIASAEVALSPFWVRHIPSFEDHVIIEIVE